MKVISKQIETGREPAIARGASIRPPGRLSQDGMLGRAGRTPSGSELRTLAVPCCHQPPGGISTLERRLCLWSKRGALGWAPGRGVALMEALASVTLTGSRPAFHRRAAKRGIGPA